MVDRLVVPLKVSLLSPKLYGVYHDCILCLDLLDYSCNFIHLNITRSIPDYDYGQTRMDAGRVFRTIKSRIIRAAPIYIQMDGLFRWAKVDANTCTMRY